MTNPYPEIASLQLDRSTRQPPTAEVVAPSDLWTPNNGRAAEFGAMVAATVLGVDRKWAEDMFDEQIAAVNGGLELAPGEALTIGIRLGAVDHAGNELTPSRVIAGHDKLTTFQGNTVPQTYVWPEMYANRPPQWWNKRLSGDQASGLVEDPLVLLVTSGLKGLKISWDEQRAEQAAIIQSSGSPTTVTEGMAILDHAMLDAAALMSKENLERPDKPTLTRFVQHDRDRSDLVVAYGPYAGVLDEQLYLHRSNEPAYPYVGFRVVRGLKASVLNS